MASRARASKGQGPLLENILFTVPPTAFAPGLEAFLFYTILLLLLLLHLVRDTPAGRSNSAPVQCSAAATTVLRAQKEPVAAPLTHGIIL